MKRAVVIAFACRQQYHIVRAVRMAGYQSYVLGQACAAGLLHSKYCSEYRTLEADLTTSDLATILQEVEAYAKDVGADMIFPSDVISTRLLAALKSHLDIPVCALPETDCFDLLDDKWQFFHYCKQQNIRTPQTWLCEDINEIRDHITQGVMSFPLIIKPHNSMGSIGVHTISDQAALDRLPDLDYSPLLVQELIIGKEVDISILAREGDIGAYTIQRSYADHYAFIEEDALYEAVRVLTHGCGYTGIAHIDAITQTDTGKIYIIEWNPRVWYSIFASTVAGINFVEESVQIDRLDVTAPKTIADIMVPNGSVKTLVKKMLHLTPLTKTEWRYLFYCLNDRKGKQACMSERYDDTRIASGTTGSEAYRVAALSRIQQQ